MKLSARELDLLSDIGKARKVRKRRAWIGLGVLLVGWAGLIYFDLDALIPVLAVFSGVAASTLGNEYFGGRTLDRLEDLLLRYVNNDPDALQQMAKRSESRDIAA